MKSYVFRVSVFVFVYVICSVSLAADNGNRFVLSAGVKSSGDQKDVVSTIYDDAEVSGAGLMLSAQLGYEIGIGEHFSVLPVIDWSIMTIKTPTVLEGYSNESYNTYFLTGASFQYYVKGYGDGLYVGLKLASSHVSMSDKLSRIDSVESDGTVVGYFVGYANGNLLLELGVENIPVLVNSNKGNLGVSNDGPQIKADFGGAYLMLRRGF